MNPVLTVGGDRKPGQGFTLQALQGPASANTDMSAGVTDVVQQHSPNFADGETEIDKNLRIVPTIDPECGTELENIVCTLNSCNIFQLGHSLKTIHHFQIYNHLSFFNSVYYLRDFPRLF